VTPDDRELIELSLRFNILNLLKLIREERVWGSWVNSVLLSVICDLDKTLDLLFSAKNLLADFDFLGFFDQIMGKIAGSSFDLYEVEPLI